MKYSLLHTYVCIEVKTAKKLDVADDVKKDEITSVLKVLLSSAKFFFLKNNTASQITKMEFYEVKTLFAEIFCFLHYLMALSEHFTIKVIEKCSSEIQSLLQVLSDYSMWMICRGTYVCTLLHAKYWYYNNKFGHCIASTYVYGLEGV